MAYLPLLVPIFDAQSIHGSDDGRQGLNGVAVDHGLVLLDIFSGEAILMDDPGENQRKGRAGESLLRELGRNRQVTWRVHLPVAKAKDSPMEKLRRWGAGIGP